MAKYRAIYQKIWKDPDFQTYTPDGKLVFIYLCTNESTTESGIYPITETTIANETSIPKETVIHLLLNGYRNIIYDEKNKFVFIRKFRRYNAGGKPELIKKSVANDFKASSETPLWTLFLEEYPEFYDAIQTVGKPLPNSSSEIRTNPIGSTNPKGNSPKANALGLSKKKIDPRVTEIFKEMESFLGYPEKVDKNPIPNYPKEGQFIKKMLGRHFTWDDILSCWKAKVQQRRGEFVSMAWVNDDIANLVRGGELLPTVKPERNKAVKPEKEGGRYGTGYRPPKPEGASKHGRTIDAEGEAGAVD